MYVLALVMYGGLCVEGSKQKSVLYMLLSVKRWCCIANIVQWLKNTALFNYSLRKQPSSMILTRLYEFLPLLKWT